MSLINDSTSQINKPKGLLSVLFTMISLYLRSITKGFLRMTTRLCELQRVCYGEIEGGSRTLAVESSFELTQSKPLKALLDSLDKKVVTGEMEDLSQEKKIIGDAVKEIVAIKQIKPILHAQFVISMKKVLKDIYRYKRMRRELEVLRAQAYDKLNEDHERSLLELWNLLQPDTPLSARKSKDWQTIGFQGEDPMTDFRGMGLLGFENLLYFSKVYTKEARRVLSYSHHPKHGYSFAIVGINITHMAYKLTTEGHAKPHFFNLVVHKKGNVLDLNDFHDFYCYLFTEFNTFWMSMKPDDVMQFNHIRDIFLNRIKDELKKPECYFRIKFKEELV